MKHNMGLYETPFNSIKTGKKIVEVRLNDEIRRKVRIGDNITFTKLSGSKETLTVEVTELREFPTFREMYKSIPAKDFDAVGGSIDEMVQQTYQIYSPEQEKEWGTLAINIRVISLSQH
ncbi:ASCH domain-containing protein [Gracilibacillus oryzae]|uniref:ASCH domain-containing protein n=1 Tax=Gracilibacillus oryzae TaxID=1672701 RepID=A0A7C8KTW0_9BACI|nr:ASCH domain-containing protein [Gracilibacillus oryzae]KAB8135753.1 ASCH domain-containing protein [Gracilibacillus oryzae]